MEIKYINENERIGQVRFSISAKTTNNHSAPANFKERYFSDAMELVKSLTDQVNKLFAGIEVI
jgi:hypothetical protein